MIDQLIHWNEQLWGAPSGVLVVLFAVALGYLLKTLPGVNNRYIPLTVVAFCTVAFMLVAPPRAADMVVRIYLVRNFLIGFILGFLAWAFHAQILKRWVDPKIFKPSDNNQPQPPTQG